MKNLNILKLIATIAIGAIAASSANAAIIQGDINIDGSGTLNGTGVNDATSLTSITASFGTGSTGDYAFISGPGGGAPGITFKDINWTTAGYTGALAIDDLWSFTWAGVTYSFDLATITTNQVVAGTLVIQGTGTAQATGYTDNPGGIFSLSSSSSGTSISFTTTTSVPDSGHTAALLGLGMLGLAGLAKRLRK